MIKQHSSMILSVSGSRPVICLREDVFVNISESFSYSFSHEDGD